MMNLPELQYQFLKKSENEMVKKYESLEALIKEMKNEYSCFQQKYATDMNEQYQSIQEQITQIKNEQVCLQQKSQTSENDIYRKFESIHGEIIEINKGYACFQQKQEISGNDIVKKYDEMQGQITELKKEQASFSQKQNELEIGINKYALMQGQMKREWDSIQQQLKKSESDMNKKCESTQGQITELKKKQNELSEKLEVFVQRQTSINEQFGFAMKQENLLNQLKEWLEALNQTKSIVMNQNTGYLTKDIFDQMISDQFNQYTQKFQDLFMKKVNEKHNLQFRSVFTSKFQNNLQLMIITQKLIPSINKNQN